MNERLYLFVVSVVVVVASLITVWIFYHLRARRLSAKSWQSILSRIIPVDKGNLRIVALDLIGEADTIDRRDGQCALESSEILDLVGDLEGLRAIQKNCDVLIDLACYCQQVYPEALVIAEELRLNARQIKWHLDRLDTAERNGSSPAAYGEYAQRIVTVYYLMGRRLVALFETSHAPGLYEVQASFG